MDNDGPYKVSQNEEAKRCDAIDLDLLEQLKSFALLKGVDHEVLAQKLGVQPVICIDEGEVLIEKGQSNAHMFLILSGSLSVHLSQDWAHPVAHLGPGESVGEVSVIDKSFASANVIADYPCRLLAVDETLMWQLIDGSHAFAVNLLNLLTARLRQNNELIRSSQDAQQKLEQAAMFDALTGIRNRRWLDTTLARLVARFRRTGEPLSIVVIDVDHFKKFNDRFGHPAGDRVLVAVAQTLSKGLRPTDFAARFGGEEFVLLLPNTAEEGARICADRMREKVALTEVKNPDDGSALPSVTFSAGVVCLSDEAEPSQLFAKADRALYCAKRNGRNQVLVASKIASYEALEAADEGESLSGRNVA